VPTKSKPAPSESRKLVQNGFATPREAALFLRISLDYLYDLIRVGAISHLRHGRRISIPWDALREYAAHRLKPGKIA
jgi:excisionase family DNA binding protein